MPEDLHTLLVRRLRQLPQAVREVLSLASAFSNPTTEAVSKVLGRSAHSPLTFAREAGVIDWADGEIRFKHPLMASAAYSEMDPEKRREVHRRLGEIVADPEQRARHLMAAGGGEYDAEVASALDAGADAAWTRGAPDVAAELREHAIAVTPPEETDAARRRAVAAASHYLAAGDLAQARALLDVWLAKVPPGPARAEILELMGKVALFGDSFHDALALFNRALPEAEGDRELVAAVKVDLGFVLAQTGDLGTSSAMATSALEDAEKLSNPALLAQALAGTTVMDFILGRPFAEDRIQKAIGLELSTPRAQFLTSPLLMSAFLNMWLGRLEESRGQFEILYQAVRERGYQSSIPLVLGLWGGAVQAACMSGDLHTGFRYAQEGMKAAADVGGDVARGLALSALSWALAYLGEAEATRKAADESAALLQQAGVSALCMWPLAMTGFVELSRGSPAAARRTLDMIADLIPGAGIGEPAATPFIADAIEALIASGDLDRAEALVQWLQGRAEALRRPWTLAMAARSSGLLLAARGDLGGAANALDAAMTEQERLPMPIERARTLLAKGSLHRRRKQKGAAKEFLQQALETFDRLGASLWAERARVELRRVGIRPSAPLELTPTEQQVADLAAVGRRTKEIAQELFMSPKTVESVITRIYRKLGTTSRAELATVLRSRVNS
ncbi:MAG: LuxR C-terminal-related transcriptional regulator [Actinomycetota bacterium]|nr:LuxR C-terminal-related transcriptional regulator [Actinomycetota bacterium]